MWCWISLRSCLRYWAEKVEDCSMRKSITLLLIAFYAVNTPASECFDDKNLSQLSAENQRGTLIYVWSPHMVYSVQQMPLAARIAVASGLNFVAVHDSRVPQSELYGTRSNRVALQPDMAIKLEDEDLATPPFFPISDASRPLCAEMLLKNEALRHFPTAFVVTAQGVHRHAIVGAMPPSAWRISIAQRLQQP
jgi:hypothetical protein